MKRIHYWSLGVLIGLGYLLITSQNKIKEPATIKKEITMTSDHQLINQIKKDISFKKVLSKKDLSKASKQSCLVSLVGDPDSLIVAEFWLVQDNKLNSLFLKPLLSCADSQCVTIVLNLDQHNTETKYYNLSCKLAEAYVRSKQSILKSNKTQQKD